MPHERLHGEGRRDDARVQGFAKERVRLVQHPGGAEGVEEPRDQRGLLPEGRAEATRGGARGGERAEDGARLSPQLHFILANPVAKVARKAKEAERAGKRVKAVEALPAIDCPHALRCRKGLKELAHMAVNRIK